MYWWEQRNTVSRNGKSLVRGAKQRPVSLKRKRSEVDILFWVRGTEIHSSMKFREWAKQPDRTAGRKDNSSVGFVGFCPGRGTPFIGSRTKRAVTHKRISLGANFYHIINQEVGVATVLVTSDDLGTPQNKQTASRILQNPTNYMTFQTLQEMKYRHPPPPPPPRSTPQRGSDVFTPGK